MSNKSNHQKPSQETQDEAMKIARASQRPGQTKEQTKLIAQGIQKGIAQYKKQQKAKSRELDKRLNKASQANKPSETHDSHHPAPVTYKQHWLPWVLLILTWIGMLVYLLGKI